MTTGTPEFAATENGIRVHQPGLLTTVQDRGRYDWQEYGFPTAGALDRTAMHWANRLVGNDPGAAVLEITAMGPKLEFMVDRPFAIGGADLSATLDGAPVQPWHVYCARRGQSLSFGRRKSGFRAYLAVAGGIDVPPVGGSRSTYLVGKVGGWQGRTLQPGDVLPLGAWPHRPDHPDGKLLLDCLDRFTGANGNGSVEWGYGLPPALRPVPPTASPIRVTLGPDDDRFSAEVLRSLFEHPWWATPDSNRMGMRLAGGTLPAEDTSEMISEPIALGAVQVPSGGQPIILLADHQTIGGYPKVATVIDQDVDRLAQLLPGEKFWFAPVSMEQARRLYEEHQRHLVQNVLFSF